MSDKKVSDETRMRELFRTPAGQNWMRKALMGQVGEQDSEALQRERRRIQAAQDVPESEQSPNVSTPFGGTSSKSQET